MAKEAEAHAGEDKAQRETIECKNQLDSLIYSAEKMMVEHGDKISGTERGEVENAIADAKKALDSNNKQTMEQARERLTQTSHKLAEQMYKAAQPQSGATSTSESGGHAKRDSGVVDAEYVDVDEKKTA